MPGIVQRRRLTDCDTRDGLSLRDDDRGCSSRHLDGIGHGRPPLSLRNLAPVDPKGRNPYRSASEIPIPPRNSDAHA